jgi:hypothetical protein
VVENYTKTSSATYEPKQSDKEFYYSPEVGVVICGERGSTVDQLNHIAFDSDDDVAQFDVINWICLDSGAVNNVATTVEDTFGELETNVKEPKILTMSINNVEYQFEEGMTWREWINSPYNSNLLTIRGSWCAPIENQDLSLIYPITIPIISEKVDKIEDITCDMIACVGGYGVDVDNEIFPVKYETFYSLGGAYIFETPEELLLTILQTKQVLYSLGNQKFGFIAFD